MFLGALSHAGKPLLSRPGMKTCSKCGETKTLDAFSADKRNRADGRQARCKACNRANYQANKERVKAYRAENADRISEYQREYAKGYREANADRLKEAKREQYQANAEHVKARVRAYQAANPERIRETKRAYYQANPDMHHAARARRRTRIRGVRRESYSRTEIFAAYGGTCAYCGDPAQHLDHVVPISRGGADAAHNLLPACAPCNLSKSAKSLAEWAATF
jgi:5-methylcytosine-specific restriction endonuclease McrA